MVHRFHPETNHVDAPFLLGVTAVLGVIGAMFIFTGVGAFIGIWFFVPAVFLALFLNFYRDEHGLRIRDRSLSGRHRRPR